MGRSWVGLAVAASVWAPGIGAQDDPASPFRELDGVAGSPSPTWAQPTAAPFRSSEARSPTPQERASGVSEAEASLLSAILPGAGQYRLGQRRAWLYLGLEAVGWVAWIDRRSDAADLRDRYRDFAWTEARIQNGPRQDADFDYYETLTQWTRSGDFDTDPAVPGVQPEMDSRTFNGTIWARATGFFLPDPDASPGDPGFQDALRFYEERAYGEAFLWDWTGTGDAQDRYGDLIRRSDDRFRQATNVLGLIIANHVISAVDAFLSARSPAVSIGSSFEVVDPGSALRWTAGVRISP